MRPLFLAALALTSLAAGCATPRADDAPPDAPAAPTPPPDASPALPVAIPTAPVEPPAVPPTPEAPALPAGPSELRTAIVPGAFAQPYIEAPKLVTVIWANEDSVTHSVVSTDGAFAGSGPIPPGGEFSRTFLTSGEFPYHCRYHGDMAGLLVVQ